MPHPAPSPLADPLAAVARRLAALQHAPLHTEAERAWARAECRALAGALVHCRHRLGPTVPAAAHAPAPS